MKLFVFKDVRKCSLAYWQPRSLWMINGRSLKVLSLIDEFTRECIALEVNRKFTGDDPVTLLVDLFAIRRRPQFIRSDNGPEFISKQVREFLDLIDVGTSYIEPGSPWENAGDRSRSAMGGFSKRHSGEINHDGDSILTRAEAVSNSERMFAKMDTNGDGNISAAEMKASLRN
ncbi:DDE-type integrase/transposase/recombinase [Planctomycetes bacterium K23_9]|uniref:Integrase core domain protein n=1 Tax=Stieleria marina TaxID=1930275 RepID=A0A517NXW4_9BACT|nr:Integrase core domain protein [Planctomycetes bacterium K23_9]